MSLILSEYQKYLDAIDATVVSNNSGQITAPVLNTTLQTLTAAMTQVEKEVGSNPVDEIVATQPQNDLLMSDGVGLVGSGVTVGPGDNGTLTNRPDYVHFGFHTIHPMGENVGFSNDLFSTLYTPTWQESDVTEIKPPNYRRYTDGALSSYEHNTVNTGEVAAPKVKWRSPSQHRTFQYTMISNSNYNNLFLKIYGISEYDFINTPPENIDLTQQVLLWQRDLGAFTSGVARTVDFKDDLGAVPIDYYDQSPLLFVWETVEEGTAFLQGNTATGEPYFIEHLRTWEDLPLPTTAGTDPIEIEAMKQDISTNQVNIATNTADISTNASGISTNSSAITTIQSEQTTQNTRLTDLEAAVPFTSSYNFDTTVINTTIVPGAHQDICQLVVADNLAAGTYELKVSHTFTLPTLLDFFEWQVDVGGTLSDAFRREPKDLDEVFGWSYFFPVIHAGGPITITLRGAVEAGGTNCTVNWANLVYERKQ